MQEIMQDFKTRYSIIISCQDALDERTEIVNRICQSFLGVKSQFSKTQLLFTKSFGVFDGLQRQRKYWTRWYTYLWANLGIGIDWLATQFDKFLGIGRLMNGEHIGPFLQE